MRTLRNVALENSDAQLALSMFTYRIIREVGSITAALNGLDALIFTAGIGENDAILRSDVIRGLSYLNLALEEEANKKHDYQISSSSHPSAFVIPTNEEALIARATMSLLP